MRGIKKRMGKEEKQVKWLCIGMVLTLIVVLIPLLWISVYNFMSADDYTFAMEAANAWRNTHSVWKVFSVQVAETERMYQTWQGTFFDIWFTGAMMGFFAEDAYYMGTVLSLGGFVAAELLLFMTILVKGLGADKCRALIVSVGCIILQVLMTPYPVEGYYWFCGALRYTFVHALVLFLLTLLLLFMWTPQERRLQVILLEIGIILLSFAIGGSNYISALTTAILYVFYCCWLFFKKHPHRVLILVDMLIFSFAFIVNVMAPGNHVRQTASGVEPMSAIRSILESFKEAGNYCLNNANLPCIILGLLMVPIFLKIVDRRNYKYPFPVLITIFSFGVFAAQFTPNIYALQILGAGRVQNLYRLNFYILVYANELYWIGWLWRRYRECHSDETSISHNATHVSYVLPGWIVGGLLLCLSLIPWGGRTLTAVSAVNSLRSGEAKQYRQEYEERLLLLEDPSQKEVYLTPFSVVPYLLYFGDVSDKTEDWVNIDVAEYYNKDIVGLQN